MGAQGTGKPENIQGVRIFERSNIWSLQRNVWHRVIHLNSADPPETRCHTKPLRPSSDELHPANLVRVSLLAFQTSMPKW